MRLREILKGCRYEIAGNERRTAPVPDAEIAGISHDSRKVAKDFLFVAVKGDRSDGHDFIGDALEKGAAAIVFEHEADTARLTGKPPLSPFRKEGMEGLESSGQGGSDNSPPFFIRVGDSREALACISNNFYERPSEKIPVVGVTGTNGKTTTTYLLKSILEARGEEVGVIGTIRYLIKDKEYPSCHTTPEASELQELLQRMVSAGCSSVLAEVSSHALALKRVDYTKFRCAVFTNLTRDHLDFHGSMEEYFEAKKRLFAELLHDDGVAVVNVDDAWGRRLLAETKRDKALTYGIDSDADIRATGIRKGFSGTSFVLETRDGSGMTIESPLIGTVNIYNVLAAAAAAAAMGIPLETVREGVRTVKLVEGRLETVEEGQGFICIVDYAHTPDALERLIVTARELSSELRTQNSKFKTRQPRIITVFGCGGNRDRGKRPLMGEIAGRLSDSVFITSDNPRNEDPLGIIKEVESGIIDGDYFVVPDRGEAIKTAIQKAGDGDIVIIAGKGHEDYQEIGGKRHRFSDREVAREAIREKLSGICRH